MINIVLQGAEFFAYHGFYPEEQKLGGRFVVDINVGFLAPYGMSEDNLANTVDYEKLYVIACEEMKHPRKLIETVAQAIINRIKSKYAFAETVQVIIKKLHPPMAGSVDHSAVIINYHKHDLQ